MGENVGQGVELDVLRAWATHVKKVFGIGTAEP